jgi:hypothetical protein
MTRYIYLILFLISTLIYSNDKNENRISSLGINGIGLHYVKLVDQEFGSPSKSVLDSCYGLEVGVMKSVLVGKVNQNCGLGIVDNYYVNGVTRSVHNSAIFDLLGVNHARINGLVVSGMVTISNEINGVATSGLLTYVGKRVNGLNLSLGSLYQKELNGLSIAGIVNISDTVQGVLLGGVGVRTEVAIGLSCSVLFSDAVKSYGVQSSVVYTRSNIMNGLQIAPINTTGHLKGLQIGLINYSQTTEGVQIGLININEKRWLPLINLNFF